MPKKRKDPVAENLVVDLAAGLCAWLLVIETMGLLERRGVLREKDSLKIIANAVASLEALAADSPGRPTFKVARVIMDSQLVGWNRDDLK